MNNNNNMMSDPYVDYSSSYLNKNSQQYDYNNNNYDMSSYLDSNLIPNNNNQGLYNQHNHSFDNSSNNSNRSYGRGKSFQN